MAKLAVISDEMTALGMRLAGVRNSFAAEPGNAQDVYNRVKADADIIVVTHSLLESIKDTDSEKITARMPDRLGGGEDTLSGLVKRVVGFEVKT